MHLFHIPQCPIQNRNVHISVLNGALWDMKQVHSGICELIQLVVIKIRLLCQSQTRENWSSLTKVYDRDSCEYVRVGYRDFHSQVIMRAGGPRQQKIHVDPFKYKYRVYKYNDSTIKIKIL